MYEFMIYIYKVCDGLFGMNSDDNYFGIFVYTIWLSFTDIILQFQKKIYVSFYA